MELIKSQKDGQLLRLRHPPRRPKLPQPSDHAFDGPDRSKQQLLQQLLSFDHSLLASTSFPCNSLSVIRLLLWSQSIKYILRLPILGPDPSIGTKKESASSLPHPPPLLPCLARMPPTPLAPPLPLLLSHGDAPATATPLVAGCGRSTALARRGWRGRRCGGRRRGRLGDHPARADPR